MKHLLLFFLTLTAPSEPQRVTFGFEAVGTAAIVPPPFVPIPRKWFFDEHHWLLPAAPLAQVNLKMTVILF